MQYSSTETYANRYDLDQIDVFLEGTYNNPMFFNISGLPQTLSIGKHYFNLFLLDSTNQDYILRENSRLLFEVKSNNNVVLRSDVTVVDQRNGIATCYLEVLQDPLRTDKEVADGLGIITVVGSLENKKIGGTTIPSKFQGAMNYRVNFPIQINKNILNGNSPFIINSEHETETIKGQYSFVKSTISPLKTSEIGLVYDNDSGLPRAPLAAISKGGSLS